MERKSTPMPLPMLKTGQVHVRLNQEQVMEATLCHHPAVQTEIQFPTYLCSSVPLEKCIKM